MEVADVDLRGCSRRAYVDVLVHSSDCAGARERLYITHYLGLNSRIWRDIVKTCG